MASHDSKLRPKPISSPQVIHLPETDTSHPVILEPYHVDLLPEYGYVTREYLIKGKAVDQPYCTRLLLRCPEHQNNFTGFVVTEPSHLWGGTSIWRHTSRWLMRNGHAWLEVDSQAPTAIGKVKNANPERYRDIQLIDAPLSKDFMETIPFTTNATKESLREEYATFSSRWWPATLQSPEILVAASFCLRSGEMGLKAKRIVLSGLSQTGGVTRRFITHSSHLRLPDGGLPFEAFIPCQSGGVQLPDIPGAKIVELLGEAEFQSVRLPCGVGGQMIGTSHRRPDTDGYRSYEVAGMGHRESRYASALERKRWSVAELNGANWSTFSNTFVYHAVFDAVETWTSARAVPPPSSAMLETIGDSDTVCRDDHGNAIGGVRTLHTEVPLAKFVAATPKGRPNWYCGSEWPFSAAKLQNLYGSVWNYRKLAGMAISDQIKAGFLLPGDGEILRRETVEAVDF